MKNIEKSKRVSLFQKITTWLSVISVVLLCIIPMTIQAQSSEFSFGVSASSGLYSGGYELDDGVIVGTDINIGWKSHLWMVQMNYAPDYVIKDDRNFQLYEYSALYGYQKKFEGGNVYFATGASYFNLKRNALSRAEELVFSNIETIDQETTNDYKNFGVPLKIGFTAHLSKYMAISSAYFANINANKSYVGYQVAIQFGLFRY